MRQPALFAHPIVIIDEKNSRSLTLVLSFKMSIVPQTPASVGDQSPQIETLREERQILVENVFQQNSQVHRSKMTNNRFVQSPITLHHPKP